MPFLEKTKHTSTSAKRSGEDVFGFLTIDDLGLYGAIGSGFHAVTEFSIKCSVYQSILESYEAI